MPCLGNEDGRYNDSSAREGVKNLCVPAGLSAEFRQTGPNALHLVICGDQQS